MPSSTRTSSDPPARALTVNLISETEGGLQGHGVHTAFLQTRAALRQAGVDVRTNSREPSDIVHIQTMGLRSFTVLLRRGSNIVVTAHIVPESLVGSFMLAPLWLPIGAAYLRLFYDMADEVVAVSPMVADELRGMGLRPPVRYVPNAIDVAGSRPKGGEREAMRARLGIPDDAFVALCVGQVQPRKGIDAFLDAARALPDVTFVWVGGMPFRRLTADHGGMLRAVADAPANVHFIGEVPHDATRGWYAAADCLFFPSKQETFGLAVVEAAAAGLPLVLRDLPAYGPLFGDRYVSGDDSTFVPWLARLRDDASLREHYSQAATELALEFDTGRLADRLLVVYADVLERAREESAARDARGARRIGPALQQAFSTWRNR